MKTCTYCHIQKELADFGYRTCKGKKYIRSYCNKCHSITRSKYEKSKVTEISRIIRNKKRNEMRKDPVNVSKCILQDAKNSDSKKNRENDLDIQFIDQVIKNGCIYCEETELRMTLDRIDNSRGHTKDNVVPACIRCNYARGNMPYQAWLCLVDGIKMARKLGLFGTWTGRIS